MGESPAGIYFKELFFRASFFGGPGLIGVGFCTFEFT
jgi:hypothetical protein